MPRHSSPHHYRRTKLHLTLGQVRSVAPDLLINGQVVEGVDKFVYLGSAVCSADGSRSEQTRRIGLAAANINNLACIWIQACLSLANKITPVYDLYCSQTALRL